MKIIAEYIGALDANDAQGVAALFSKDCYLSDGAVRILGLPDVEAHGKEEVREAFAGIFSAFSEVKAKLVRENPNSAEYDVVLDGTVLPCVGAATCNDEGLISEYIIRPR